MQQVRAVNGVPDGLAMSPRTQRSINGLKNTLNDALELPDDFVQIPKYLSNQIPTNLTHGTSVDCSTAFIGQWSNLAFGLRTNLILEVSREAGTTAGGSAWGQLEILCRAYLRAGVSGVGPPRVFRPLGL